MASAADIYNQMQSLQTQANAMTPADQSAIQRDLMSKVGFFKPQYEELAGKQAAAYAAPATLMNQYMQNYGAVGGPSALSRLSSVLGNIGQQYGTADVLSNVINTQGGKLGDLAKSALDQYNAQREALQQQYSNLTPLYQTQMQSEEDARQREFTANQARLQQAYEAQQNALNRAATAKAASEAANKSILNWGGPVPVQQQAPVQNVQRSPFEQVQYNIQNAIKQLQGR
jgi:hypothetical protein